MFLPPLADDDRQLGLVVDLIETPDRDQHVIVRADHALRNLGEDDGPELGIGIVVP